MKLRSGIYKGVISILFCSILAAFGAMGCTGARMGVGLPRAMIYKNVRKPFTMKRNRNPRAKGVAIPEKLNRGTASAYKLDLKIPTLEYTRPLSFGWGDVSLEKAFSNGSIKELVYADAREIEILGIFTKSEIIVYGVPADNP